MKHLIRHLFDNNHKQIASLSLKNCHTKGLHSIMLLESPERTIRLYITEDWHDLFKNEPEFYPYGQSIAFHPHHCNLTIECVYGRLDNHIATFMDSAANPVYSKYLYKSKITSGETKFTKIGGAYMLNHRTVELRLGQATIMRADEIHTVWCPRNYVNAWLVYEGLEDPNYTPICYTMADPNAQVTDDLYQPMTLTEAYEMTKSIGLI